MSASVARALRALYEEIHAFAIARDRGDTPLALRRVSVRALDSDLMLLGQGLAQSTQRVTGYPYREPRGLSRAGRRLDSFLRPIGYTIDHTDETRRCAYSTDLVPWYPGKKPTGKGDLTPTPDEVALCWQWFEREYALIQPRAIILLGRCAADRYLRRYGHERLVASLAAIAGLRFESSVGDREVVAVAAYHPSAVWGVLDSVGRETWRRAVAALRPDLERN